MDYGGEDINRQAWRIDYHEHEVPIFAHSIFLLLTKFNTNIQYLKNQQPSQPIKHGIGYFIHQLYHYLLSTNACSSNDTFFTVPAGVFWDSKQKTHFFIILKYGFRQWLRGAQIW